MTVELVRLTVDGVEVDVPKGTMIVDAAKKAGIDIPVFCYHPKLKPVGMCRMCLVEVGRPTMDRNTGKPVLDARGATEVTFNPKLETACTTPVGQGFVVRVMTEKAMLARRQIVEFLLTSHPLDCPVCDKGGECPLQELTMDHGAGESRYHFDEKIRLDKRVPLGDLIFLDRERCIQCARCVRFQEEIVDDPVIGFYERGRRLEIITFSEPGFNSYFSGNTTDICPVGALTTADFRFGARTWELNASASICPHCPVGCNLTLNTRREARAGGREVIKRVMPRQNESVNEIWICDKGRFGHHFAASPERLTTPLIRKDGQLVEATWDEALDRAAEGLRRAGGSLLGLAGGRLANEDFFLLRRLVEGIGGKAALFEEMGGGEVVSRFGPTQGTELGSLGADDALLVVACDLHEETPIWWLRAKQAAERGAKVIVMNARATRLEDIATHVVHYPTGHAARAGLGLLMTLEKGDGAALTDHEAAYRIAAETIKSAGRLVIFFGSEGLDREGSDSLARTCANLLVATGHAGKVDSALIPVWPHGNSQGAWDIGLRPLGKHLSQEVERAAALYVTACDPAGDDAQLERHLLAGKFLLVQELFMTRTASLANVVLPAQSWAEREGTYTTGMRRVQRFYPALPRLGQSRADWSIVAGLGRRLGLTMAFASAAEVMKQLAAAVEGYAGISYQSLAVVEPQGFVVGDEDLYYGGTSYKNKQGTGVQLSRPQSEIALLEVTAEQPLSAGRPNQLLLVPITRLLAPSTTLAASKVLQARMVPRRVSLNPEDATRWGIQPEAVVELRWNGGSEQIRVQIDSAVPSGVAWMPRNTGAPLLSRPLQKSWSRNPSVIGETMDAALIAEWVIKSIVYVATLAVGFAYLTFFERRVLARMQVRIGPNRTGPGGWLQPVADGLKLIFKEELIPENADKLLFILAPVVTVVPALIVVAVLPLGPDLVLFGRTIRLGLADDINIGVLYILAVTSIAVYGINLAGWSSNNKYALMGGLRSTAQMVSYELAMGLSVVGPIMLADSMSLRDIVDAQRVLPFAILQPLGFLIFGIGSVAEVNRAPFDMPEAEQELTAGYHVEYSGMKFALFFMAEYVKMIAVSAISATLFLGGYQGPFIDQLPWLGPIYLGIKVVALLFGMVWLRATLPRFRYDRLMAFGWKILLPLALLNVAVTAVLVVLFRG